MSALKLFSASYTHSLVVGTASLLVETASHKSCLLVEASSLSSGGDFSEL